MDKLTITYSVISLSILLISCSPANLVITGETRSPISPSSVVIYNEQSLPSDYEIIGSLNVQTETSLGRGRAQNRNIEKLKEKSASVGGNGLILGDVHNSHAASGSSYMSMNATVIYVDPNIELKSTEIKTESIAERLRELKQLYDDGILTKEEYEILKKRLLDNNK